VRADVVVIGGGITGLATALNLARRSVGRVVVVERGYLGAGSTFKCAGGIRASFSSEEHVVLMKRSIELWGELSKELGFYYERGGYVWLLTREEQLETFKELMSFHNSLGLPTRLLDPDELGEIVPSLDTSRVVGALYDSLAGKASPFEALHSMYLEARMLDVEFLTHTEAHRLVVEEGSVKGVETNKGEIAANVVVVATGYGTRKLLETAGIFVPLENVPHHALITEPYAETFKPLLVDVSTGAYLVQVKYGNFLMGVEVEEEPGAEPTPRADFIPKVLRVWSNWLPWLPNTVVLRYWTGYYVMTPDKHPVIGPTGVEGLYVAAGFSGHGFMMAPVVAEELTNWILEGKPRTEQASRLTLSRFAEGRLIHEKIVIG